MPSHKELFLYIKQNEQNLKKISSPLEDIFNIKFLAYRKFFLKEKKLLYLINHPEWLKELFENKLWGSHYFYNKIKDMPPYHVNIWPQYPDPGDITFEKLYNLNIWNGIVLYFRQEDCVETFCFTGDRTHDIQNFFLNNQPLLQNFVHHFKYTGRTLLEGIKFSNLINFDTSLFSPLSSNVSKNGCENSSTIFSPKKYCLHVKGEDLFITEKEKICLSYLSKGKTYKEAALLLDISSRTIEDHINRLKLKLGCVATSDLIELYVSQIEFFYGLPKTKI